MLLTDRCQPVKIFQVYQSLASYVSLQWISGAIVDRFFQEPGLQGLLFWVYSSSKASELVILFYRIKQAHQSSWRETSLFSVGGGVSWYAEEGIPSIQCGVNLLRSTPQIIIQANLTIVYCLTVIIVGLLIWYVTIAITRIEKRTYFQIYKRKSREKKTLKLQWKKRSIFNNYPAKSRGISSDT